MIDLTDAELRRRADLCDECEARDCAYNFNGMCRLPLAFGVEPSISDEGDCVDYLFD